MCWNGVLYNILCSNAILLLTTRCNWVNLSFVFAFLLEQHAWQVCRYYVVPSRSKYRTLHHLTHELIGQLQLDNCNWTTASGQLQLDNCSLTTAIGQLDN